MKLIADKRNKWAGWTNWGEHSQYDVEGNLVKTQNIKPIAEFSLRTNIWRYPVSFNDKTGHPAVFPEKLAEDHILSWSNEGETVLDPFMGSGTTAKMAMMNKRNYIGFEVNTEYFDKSINRVEKYEGKFNDKVQAVSVQELINIDKDKKEIDTDTLQLNPVDDKDLDKKAELWKELTSELSDYFNTQSLGILRNLKVNLTFASKANDRRVEQVLKDKGMYSGAPEEAQTYCEGAKGPQEIGDWRGDDGVCKKVKKEYVAPERTVAAKALTEEDKKEIHKEEAETGGILWKYTHNHDAFIKDVVEISPNGVKMAYGEGTSEEPAADNKEDTVDLGLDKQAILDIIKEEISKDLILMVLVLQWIVSKKVYLR